MPPPLPAQRNLCRTFEQHGDITLCGRQIANFEYDHAGVIQCNTQRSQMIDSACVLNIVLGHTYGLIWESLQPESPRESAPYRSPIEKSPASQIEMSRSLVCLRLVEVAWDDGDHDEPQRAGAPAGADRHC